MDRNRRIYFENASGEQITLNSPEISKWFELGSKSGFAAPDVEIKKQKYANGVTKILKRTVLPRTVSFVMLVIGTSDAERDRIFANIANKLIGTTEEGEGKLYIQKSDGMTVYLNCVYSAGMNIKDQYRKARRFALEFYAADPYFYRDLPLAVLGFSARGRLALRDGVALGNHKLGEITGETSGNIENTCDEILHPYIDAGRVRGSLTIENYTTGSSLKFSGINTPLGGNLIIDTREKSKGIYIKKADGEKVSAGQYLDWNELDFDFEIAPGNNDIHCVVGQGSYTDAIKFHLAERYLSV